MSEKKRLLLVDDDSSQRLLVCAVLSDAAWDLCEAASGEIALDLYTKNPSGYDVVLLDMRMPGIDGIETMRQIHQINPEQVVVLLTAFGTVGSAVSAMKEGAHDYLTKPVDNEELLVTLEKAFHFSRLKKENELLQNKLTLQDNCPDLVGNSPKIRSLKSLIQQAAPSEATVLILGESGTGKELIAKSLHANSLRKDKPFLVVNCAALPEQLLESELFGYEKGAFTGAVKSKAGRFQLAAGGTLFLDEIGEMPLALQAKLLRVLQEKVVEPLGSIHSIATDVRIFAATNKNLQSLVGQNLFREDLFFRLHVIEILSPPLRERLEDLPLLVQHFLQLLASKNKTSIRGVSPEFFEALSRYSWPGNIRELQNVLERALILSRTDTLSVQALPSYILEELEKKEKISILKEEKQGVVTGQVKRVFSDDAILTQEDSVYSLEDAEYQALLHALESFHGHREKTAQSLGISRRALQYKLKKYKLTNR